MFVPYPFRPFWQPNSRTSLPVFTELERITQKLNTAEKKVDEYARLVASLSADLKRYEDIMCLGCRENIIRATLAIASVPTPVVVTQSASIAAASEALSDITAAAPSDPSPSSTISSIQEAAESSFCTTPSISACGPSSRINDLARTVHSSVIAATAVPRNLQTTSSLSSTTTPISPASGDAQFQPGSTQPEPYYRDWSVEYNPEIKQNFSLHVANIFKNTAKVFCVKFSRDGKYLAVGLQNGEIHIYDILTGSKSLLAARSATVFQTAAVETAPAIWDLHFSLDNKYLIAGGSRKQIMIWEIDRKRVRAVFKHAAYINFLDISPNGRFLASVYNNSVCMLSLRGGSRRRLLDAPSDFVSVVFSPDGQYVAAGNKDGFVWILDARTSWVVAKCPFGGSGLMIPRVIFRPDGTGIASGEKILRCWDFSPLRDVDSRRHMMKDGMEQLKQIFEFRGHKERITAVSFSSDNRWLASSSLDQGVCILDAQSGAWLSTLRVHVDVIWAVDFSPVGHYVVSGGEGGGENGFVRLWKKKVAESF